MQIAVVGAGIGGLACTLLLRRQNHSVSIFDQFTEPAPVGSGLMLQPVGLAVLDHMGLGDAARDMGAPISRLLGHSARSGRRVLDTRYGAQPGLGIHRAAVFDLLFKAAMTSGPTLHTDRKVIAQKDGQLHFENGGRSEVFDLIIDSSGAGSLLSPLAARPLAFGAIWGTVDWVDGALPSDMLTQRYRQANRMTGILPVGRMPGGDIPKAALFWLLPHDGHAEWLDRGLAAWKAEACDLWPALAPFVAQIDAPERMTMARYSHGTLTRPIGPGTAFIGDAAHRASPQLGQGANMALLDAFALAHWLEHEPPTTALERYAASRHRHVGLYQLASRVFTPLYQSESRLLPWLRDTLLFPASILPPISWTLTSLVRGDLLPPIRGADLPLLPRRFLTEISGKNSHG